MSTKPDAASTATAFPVVPVAHATLLPGAATAAAAATPVPVNDLGIKIDLTVLRGFMVAGIVIPFVIGLAGIYGWVPKGIAIKTFLTGLSMLVAAMVFTLLARLRMQWFKAPVFLLCLLSWIVALLAVWEKIHRDYGWQATLTGIAALMASGALALVTAWTQ